VVARAIWLRDSELGAHLIDTCHRLMVSEPEQLATGQT
jgi:hypothetical protein